MIKSNQRLNWSHGKDKKEQTNKQKQKKIKQNNPRPRAQIPFPRKATALRYPNQHQSQSRYGTVSFYCGHPKECVRIRFNFISLKGFSSRCFFFNFACMSQENPALKVLCTCHLLYLIAWQPGCYGDRRGWISAKILSKALHTRPKGILVCRMVFCSKHFLMRCETF